MKTILIISPTGGYAGIDVCLETLVLGMDKSKFKPIVVFPYNAFLKPKFEEQGILCYELPLNWWFPIGFSSKDLLYVLPTLKDKIDPLVHIIRDNAVDIVLTNTSVGLDGGIAAAICNVPNLFFLHARYEDNIYKDMQPETKEFLYMVFEKLSYKSVCCSRFLHEFIDKYSHNSMYIYNGVDVDRFQFRKRSLGNNDKLNLVCVGHYNANKQQDFVIDSLKSLKKSRPELASRVTFTMVGPGEPTYKDKLKKMVKEYHIENQVNFEDFRDDINTYLDNFNVYVNSSITENLPVSVIEAMACGLPVLGTPNDGNLQLVVDNQTGFITPTPEIMAEKLIYLLENPEVLEKFSVLGRQRVEKDFSHLRFVAEFERLFDEINNSCSKGIEYSRFINDFYESVTGISLTKYPYKNVLVIYPPQATATFHIAARQPLEHLAKMNLIDYKAITPSEFNIDELDQFDVVYCLRYYDDFIKNVMNEVQKRHKPFIWFIDDNYSALTFKGNSVEHKHIDNEPYEKMYRKSDAVLVNSGTLYHFGKKFTDKIYRLPTYQVDNDEFLKTKLTNDSVTIGFIGTLMRDGDFECVIPALQKIMDTYDNVQVEFIGYCPEELENKPRVKKFDFINDYDQFREFFASRCWDIGLAPLNDTEFNRSKTNNKYREYSSFKIPGIYSNISTYNFCVVDGQNGILTENTEAEWYLAIKKLIESPGLRCNLAKNAWFDIKENYNIEKFAKKLMDVFCKFSSMPVGASIIGKSFIEELQIQTIEGIFIQKPYDPDSLSFSGNIIQSRKYNVFCEKQTISQIGILFGQENPASGNITINVYSGEQLLGSSIKTIQELQFSTWNYFTYNRISETGGKTLTIEILCDYQNGAIGVFEDRSRRSFLYKVFNKLGYPLKGMNALMVDIVD